MPRFFFSDAMVRLLKFRVTATSVQLRSTGSNQLEEPMLSRLVSEEKSLQFASRRDQSSIKISKCWKRNAIYKKTKNFLSLRSL